LPAISFMSANYVAEHVGYNMTEGWSQGERATSTFFEPLETYAARLDALLRRVRALGFDAMDMWIAHLHPGWATDDHISTAARLLSEHGMSVPSIAGSFGSTPQEFDAACRVAKGIGAPIMGGMTDLLASDRNSVVRSLESHDLILAVENHPEKTPEEMMDKIGGGDGGRIGTTIDTGWYATHGYDAAVAVEKLAPSIRHVHLKDIRTLGEHVTCPYGEGIVPLSECVEALVRSGYQGTYTVEHEPDDHDPSDEIQRSSSLLMGWLEENRADTR
jgi:L-ribulose-5-phosphate 3-epimerase